MTGAERHYLGEEGKRYHEIKRGIPAPAVPWVAKLRAEKIQPLVGPGQTVLEYGAGFGWNLSALQCARRVAYDIAEIPPTENHNIEWVRDLNSLPAAFADVIICHHVLEHVLDPAEVLAKISDLLAPLGRLLLYVPFEKERRYRQYHQAEPNHHLYSWNVQTLGNLANECGFRIESACVDQFGYDRFAAKLALRSKSGETGFRMIRTLAHLLRPALEVRIVAAKA